MEETLHPWTEIHHKECAIYAPRHAPAAQLYHPFACLTICRSACAAANDLWPIFNGDPIVTRAAELAFAYLSCSLHLVNACLVGTMRVCLGTATPVHSRKLRSKPSSHVLRPSCSIYNIPQILLTATSVRPSTFFNLFFIANA